MTKKDYELIARTLKTHRCDEWPADQVWRDICIHLADAFAVSNPNFKREKFLQACR